MAFDARLGRAYLGNLELGWFEPDVLPPAIGTFTSTGATVVVFTGHSSAAPVPPEITFTGVLGLASPGKTELGMVLALAFIRSDGHTSVAFNVPNPVPHFESDGATFILWVITHAGIIFESDGATVVAFTGKSTASFREVGSTTVTFTGNTGGRVVFDGQTDVVFLVVAGQSAGCLVGDGVAPTSTGSRPKNAVY